MVAQRSDLLPHSSNRRPRNTLFVLPDDVLIVIFKLLVRTDRLSLWQTSARINKDFSRCVVRDTLLPNCSTTAQLLMKEPSLGVHVHTLTVSCAKTPVLQDEVFEARLRVVRDLNNVTHLIIKDIDVNDSASRIRIFFEELSHFLPASGVKHLSFSNVFAFNMIQTRLLGGVTMLDVHHFYPPNADHPPRIWNWRHVQWAHLTRLSLEGTHDHQKCLDDLLNACAGSVTGLMLEVLRLPDNTIEASTLTSILNISPRLTELKVTAWINGTILPNNLSPNSLRRLQVYTGEEHQNKLLPHVLERAPLRILYLRNPENVSGTFKYHAANDTLRGLVTFRLQQLHYHEYPLACMIEDISFIARRCVSLRSMFVHGIAAQSLEVEANIIQALKPATLLKHLVLGTGHVRVVQMRDSSTRQRRRKRIALQFQDREERWKAAFPQVSRLYLWGHVWPPSSKFHVDSPDIIDSSSALQHEWDLSDHPGDYIFSCTQECFVGHEFESYSKS